MMAAAAVSHVSYLSRLGKEFLYSDGVSPVSEVFNKSILRILSLFAIIILYRYKLWQRRYFHS